jgi:hypothetical protein
MSTVPLPPSVLDRLLTPVADCLTVEVAERIANVKTDVETQKRLDELREKANFGLLTPDEAAEYDEYVEGLDLLAILKLKARGVVGKRA